MGLEEWNQYLPVDAPERTTVVISNGLYFLALVNFETFSVFLPDLPELCGLAVFN